MLLDADMQWSALVPVKAGAKSRLDPDPEVRARLSAAFLNDVLTALSGAPEIDDVVVVTDDPSLRAELSSHVRRHLTKARGLNAELVEALHELGSRPVMIVAADLPCLNSDAVSSVLQLAQSTTHAFVTDTQGLGTTTLLAHAANDCVPMFGVRSHARHAQAGYRELTANTAAQSSLLVRARRDVDTALDLWDAIRIGVGPASTAALAEKS